MVVCAALVGLLGLAVTIVVVAPRHRPVPAVAAPQRPADAADAIARTRVTPLVGVLVPSAAHARANRAAGIDTVVLSARWESLQPRRDGALDPVEVDRLRAAYREFREAGLRVILSPGLQYPPGWVFEVDPDTRFVDQFGRAWHGGPGEDVADAVWNPHVRAAQHEYLGRLGAAVHDLVFEAVRAGGLLDGELRLPDGGVSGRSMWGFGTWAARANPAAGWLPGQPGRDRAAVFIRWYLDSLVGYQGFIVAEIQRAFPDAPIHVLYPNVGLRPGQVEEAVAGALGGHSVAERNGNLAQGLDWAAQIAALPKRGVVAHLTDLDRPGTGTTAETEAPIAYLSALAGTAGIPVSGENQGRNGVEVLDRCFRYARQYRLTALLWMSEAGLYSGGARNPMLDRFRSAVTGWRRG
jgi:hypothetical protein